jgi:hypothetical protein
MRLCEVIVLFSVEGHASIGGIYTICVYVFAGTIVCDAGIVVEESNVIMTKSRPRGRV